MRKLLFTILILLLVIQSFSVNAEAVDKYSNLKVLEITAEEIGAVDMDAPATRKELAYIASKLADGNTYKETETIFEDVSQKTGLTGYIANAYNLGILSGVEKNMFAPEEFVTVDAVYKVFSVVLGYNEIAEIYGGYPDGYRKVANDLGFSQYINVNADGKITIAKLFAAADSLLEHEYEKLNYQLKNNGLSFKQNQEKISVLTQRHEINVYRGVITGINEESFYATVTITESVFSSNKVHYEEGTTITIPSDKNINLYEFENAPVTLWIKNDEKIVNVELQKGVEILFGTVDAVNSDSNASSEYKVPYIERISLYNDNRNYHTTANFKVRYNFSDTNAPVKLTNKFVKMVLYNEKVMFLETWELSEGGIITQIATDYIGYTHGDNDSKRISDMNLLEKIIIYSDNTSVDINNLKIDTYFDYFRHEEKLVIVASEKRISDKFLSISTDELRLGNGKYDVLHDIYFQDKNGGYQKNTGYIDLLNKTVTAYFDAKGYCRYIRIADGEEVRNNRFLGLILGSSSDVFKDKTELKVLPLEGDKEIRILKLREKCKLNCGKSLNEILAIQDTIYANNVLEFILNDKAEIIEINDPELFYGFSTAKKAISQFTDDQNPYVEVDGQYLYFKNAPIALLLEKDGELYVKNETWNNLYGKKANNVTMTFYGNGMSSNLRLVLISGNTDSISSKYTDYGFVTERSTVLNEVMEPVPQITVTSGSQKDYIVTDKVLADIAEGNSNGSDGIIGKIYFINYSTLDYNEESDIEINSSVCLDDILSDPAGSGWIKAIVHKVDSKRLFIEGNPVEAYFYHNSNIVVKVQPDESITKINVEDISAGDTVYIKRDTEGIKGIIVK